MQLSNRTGKRAYAKLEVAKLAGIALLSLAATTTLTSCKDFFKAVNNNPVGNGTSTYVYVTNVGAGGAGGTLTEYSLTSGVLAQLSGSPISLPATPTSVVVAPNNKFVFVGTNLGVFVYTIGTDGTLTEGNNNTIIYLGASQTEAMAVDSTSSWLIIANQNSNVINALPIDPTTGIPTSNTPATSTLKASTPQQIAFSPANDNIFVALGAGGTDALAFSASNSSNPLGPPFHIGLHTTGTASTTSTSANAVAVDTTSTYVFIGESTSNILRQIAIADLTKDVADPSVGKAPSSILPDATGAYVYVANQTDNTITGFTLSAGVLTVLDASPFATGKAPIGLVEDSSKTYIMSAGFGANPNLWLYSFDASVPGTLDISTTTSTTTTSPSNSNSIAVTH